MTPRLLLLLLLLCAYNYTFSQDCFSLVYNYANLNNITTQSSPFDLTNGIIINNINLQDESCEDLSCYVTVFLVNSKGNAFEAVYITDLFLFNGAVMTINNSFGLTKQLIHHLF